MNKTKKLTRPKKQLLIFCLVSLLLSGSFTAVLVDINATRDTVVIHEECYHGDRRAADGLTVYLDILGGSENADRSCLRWQIDYTFGAEPIQNTRFSYDTSPPIPEIPRQTSGSAVFDTLWNHLSYDQTQLHDRYLKLADEAKITGHAEETFRLSEYVTSIPLSIDCTFLDPYYDREELKATPNTPDYHKKWAYVRDTLQEKLVIPVDPSWLVTMTVGLREGGDLERSFSGDLPRIQSVSVTAEDAVYLLVQNGEDRLYDATQLDSEVLGLYVIPRDPLGKGASALQMEKMEQVYRPESRHRMLAIEVDPFGQNLLLIGRDAAGFTLTVLDLKTFHEKATVRLADMQDEADESEVISLTVNKDLVSCRVQGQALMVFARAEDGLLQEALRLDLRIYEGAAVDEEIPCWIRDEPTDIYRLEDGQVAILGRDPSGCGFYIAVYDGRNLLYHARYYTDLDAKGLRGSYNCHPIAEWQESHSYK